MPWTDGQTKRFAKEEQILKDYFPNNVKWFNRDNMKVEIKMTSNSNKSYTLRVCIPQDYPNSCPELYVCNPARPLKDIHGNEIDCGTDNHSYGTKNGLTSICHFVPYMWSNEYTLYQVFMKGRIWLEAYEIHLRTGNPMKTYLREMESNIPMEELLEKLLAGLVEQGRAGTSSSSTEQRPQLSTDNTSENKSKGSCLLM